MIAKGKNGDQRRKQKQRRKALSWLMVLCMVLTMFSSQFAAAADDDNLPAHSKTLTDNHDGTHKLELSITGDADTETQEAGAVDVVIVYDVSSSMDTRDVRVGNNNYRRNDQAEDVVHDFLTNLNSYSNGSNIRVSLVNFAVTGDQIQGWTTNVTGLANRFDDNGTDNTVSFAYTGSSHNGTNWESALQRAQTLVNSSREDVPTFVILITDGAPTASGNGSNAVSPTTASIQTLRDRYNAATGEAYAIASALSAKKGTFYGIYAYSQEADLLDDLMYYSINNQHRGGNINNVTGNTQTPHPNYFNAGNTDDLNAAISEIFDKIVQAMGISSVSITDGTTHAVETSTGGISELLEVIEDYQYWIDIPVVNGQFTRIDRDGNTVTYRVTDNGNGTCTVRWGSNSVTVNGKVSSGHFKYEWEEANALYNYDPPAASFNEETGAVDWDLSDVGTLLDGVTYSVTFDVYPSQETLDDVADIKNDPYESASNPGAWGDLDPNVQQYLDKNGNLATNTTASFTFVDTRTGESGEGTYTNPDPVETSAVEELVVSKEWHNELENEWDTPAITLDVTRDGKNAYTTKLSEENDWKDNVFISIGIMRTHGEGANEEIELLTTGHNFTFDEPAAASGYKWELDVPVVRPMKINGTDTILVLVDEAHPAPAGAKTYTLPDKDGVAGGTYYVSDLEELGLTAINERRSSVNLTKVVNGEDVPENATFPFTVNIENSMAPETAPSDDPNHDSDYWVWISVRDKDKNPVTEGISGATHSRGGWWYAPSGTDVTIPVKAGYSIRFNNLPVGSKYTITEGDLADGFVFEDAGIEVIDGIGTKTDTFEVNKNTRTASGEVQETNTLYQVTMTNKYEYKDVSVDKVWADSNNQDGIRPESLTLTLNGMPQGMTVPTPEILKSEDGNTWTYTWKGVPKYDARGNEINYTVTEETVPDGYDCSGSPAVDGGTITNTHTPEVTEVKATKVWDDADDQDRKRPDEITLRLYKADGDEFVLVGEDGLPKKIAKDATGDDLTVTWTNLPKKEKGKEITYKVLEDPIDESLNYTTKVEGDMEKGFTVTNSHAPEETTHTVYKVWSDGEDKYHHRPEQIEITLLANGVAKETITLPQEGDKPWEYTWEHLPKRAEGSLIEYEATEERLPYYEEPEIEHEQGTTTTTITNKRKVDETTYKVVKIWDDAGDQDGVRPGSIEVTLYQNGKEFATHTLTAEEGWQYTWTGLEKNNYEAEETTEDPGNKAKKASVEEEQKDASDADKSDEVVDEPAADSEKSVEEPAVDSEEPAADSEKAVEEPAADSEKAVEEPAADSEKAVEEPVVTEEESVGEPADDVTVDETVAEELSDEAVETEDNASEEELGTPEKRNAPERAAAKAVTLVDYVYTADEDETSITAAYTKTDVDHDAEAHISTITNKHTPEQTKVTITKEWVDNNNQDGLRKTTQEYAGLVHLYANGELYKAGEPAVEKVPEVTDKGQGVYEVTFTDLPKNADGEQITYTVKEDPIPGYTTTPTSGEVANGGKFTNTHTPDTTKIAVKKTWADAGDQDGKRADVDATVQLYKTVGDTKTAVGDPVPVGTAADWSHEWTKQPVNEGGVQIIYSVEETIGNANSGYEKRGDNATLPAKVDDSGTIAITNTYSPETVTINGTKTWKDSEYEGLPGYTRPTSITVNLKAKAGDRELTAADLGLTEAAMTKEVTGKDNWTYEFTGLPKYLPGATGTAITYSVEESAVPGFNPSQGELDYDIDNTPVDKEEVYTPVSLTLKKTDALTGDAIEGATFTLKDAEGTTVGTYEVGKEGATVTFNKPGSYTLAETKAPDGYEKDNLPSFPVTVDKDLVKVELNQDATKWQWFYDLFFDDETKALFNENTQTLIVPNTPEPVDVSITKEWDDADNQDGYRLTADKFAEKVHLYADGEEVTDAKAVVTENENGIFTVTYSDLPKMKNGVAITYTVKEDAIPEYTTKDNEVEDGGKIINTHKPETVTINGTKTWKDSEYVGQPGYERPESITVNLKAAVDGEAIDLADLKLPEGYETSKTVTPDEDGNWTFEFKDLPKNLPGKVAKAVTYSVEETAVPGYDASKGELAYDIDNTPVEKEEVVEPVELTINKTDVNTKHPLAGATFTITKDDKQVGDPQKTGETGSVTFKFEEAGTYTLTETPPTGYKAVGPWTIEVSKSGVDKVEYNGDSNKWNWFYHLYFASGLAYEDGTLTIPNTPKETSVEATKVWDDKDNSAGLRQDVTIHLDKKVGDTVTEDCQPAKTIKKDAKDEALTVKWDKLPAYEDGMEVTYTVREDKLEGYEEPVITGDAEEGYTITNSMKFGDVRITKDLLTYEDSSEATFVYSVKATLGVGKKTVTVYDGVVTLDFTSATTASAVIKDLPAGAKVDVEELYSGAAYEQKSGPTWDAEDQTIVADDEIGVEFSNAYNGELTQGYGILNEYEAKDGKWVHVKEIINSNDAGEEQ